MQKLATYVEERTCGEACWQAREDICRCSCFGKNHGVLRGEDGLRPTRTRRAAGYVYVLHAVESNMHSARIVSLRPMELLDREIDRTARHAGIVAGYDAHTFKAYGEPTLLRTASDSNVRAWPELADWRGEHMRPVVLWILQDVADLIA